MLPFYALGPSVKHGFTSTETFTHSSLLRTIETVFGVAPLASVAHANDLRDLFTGNAVPTFAPA